eukprot:6098916-Prorocentrum_lima.AAC.1
MTSSLVGSEMCIRDSFLTFALVRTPSTTSQQHPKLSSLASLMLVGSAPVSYTHLTLPTICSV